jgi:superfamily II DNA or RNA helicase
MSIPALDAYRASKPCRDYQISVAEQVVAHLDNGRIPLMVMPTGAGKSRVLAEVMGRVAVRRGLVVTHTDVLFEQSKNTIPGCSVINIQALTAAGAAGDRRRNALSEFDAAAIDEAHHSVSEQWVGAMQLLRSKGLKVFGASATPQRGDGRALDEFWTDMVVGPNYSELVEWGFLCPCDVAKPKLTRREQKKQKVRIDGVQSYLEHGKRADGSWRPGIFFHKTISDCEDAARRFDELGIRSKVVSCEITGQARQDIFDAYSRGDLDMLCSPQALAEGFDSPRAEVCVLCRSASSLGTYLQMVGRILRPCAGKTRALLIDCTGAESIHGKPTKDRLYSLSGEGITDAPEEQQLTPEQEQELKIREEWKQVRAEFELVRDQLQTKLYELRQEAVELQKNNGWAFAQFRKHVQYKDERGFTHDTIKVPYIFDAKKMHVCEICRHRVKVGETVLSGRDKKVFHSDCYFQSLSEDELTAYKMRGVAVAAQ